MAVMTKSLGSLGIALLMLAGCATMGGSGPERISVDSNPAGADVQIECDSKRVGSGVTPASILVPRTSGDCVVAVTREGYEPQKVLLEQGFNRLYWGNIPLMVGLPVGLYGAALSSSNNDNGEIALLLGIGVLGAAGMVIDNVTDAQNDHDPKRVMVTLKAIR